MGAVHWGGPREMMLFLRDLAGAKVFVETGTYAGDTTAWAAEHFDRVVSIEGSPALHAAAVERLAGLGNVRCELGDSRAALGPIVDALEAPAVLWLDGHWCGSDTFGGDAECPVLDEIAAVVARSDEHVVLVDDARYFLAPPPLPHEAGHWPTLPEVIDALRGGGAASRYIIVHEDVIVSVPRSLQEKLSRYVQQVRTRASGTASIFTPMEAAP